MKRPAIFFDRDGTLCDEVGYLNDLRRMRIFPYAVDAVRLANRNGFLAVLVTNQAGVARGYFPESLVGEAHQLLEARLEEGGARFDRIYYCPHHPTAGEPPYRQACHCRKPKPGLLRRAEAECEADLGRSYVIGDRYHDLELAWAVGARGVLVRTGYGAGELVHQAPRWQRPPDMVAAHALEAVERILHEAQST
jgi:D-glycero-D-manno-heptose 1,7-bisphosphate phosphatase